MVAVGLFALLHAARQRPDAFTAVEKLTKGKWLAIVAAGTAAVVLFGAFHLLGIVGVVAVCVYLADVRPKVDEVQRGSRW